MPSYGILLGLLMIVGFAMSVINGMLYKIVPFLVWFHLQSNRGIKSSHAVPNVREILPESRARRQMWLHFAALCALLVAVIFPVPFFYPAALLFGGSNLLLWLNIVEANRTYHRVYAQLAANAVGAPAATNRLLPGRKEAAQPAQSSLPI
jgi:uncharacterized membrane protein YciS (DUF1049 family)